MEDEELLRKELALALRLEGFNVFEASNGKEALEILSEREIDVVITDIRMPCMDGITLLRKIKDIDPLVEVILITGHGDVNTAIAAVKYEAFDFLRKPVDVEELVLTLKDALTKRKANIEMKRYQEHLERKVIEKTVSLRDAMDSLERLSEGIMKALASAIEARDPYTEGHGKRVGEYSALIARELGLNGNDGIFKLAGLLHDIGKIGIPDSILLKPSSLTKEEFEIIKLHPVLGYMIVEPIEFLGEAKDWIRCHHERLDGSGYPSGLSGDQIPLGASILAVADIFDACTSARAYRPPMSVERTLEIIEKDAKEGKLDPEVVKVALKVFREIKPKEKVSSILSFLIEEKIRKKMRG
ncbi:MAG: response regulator [Synergistetes bacterium]|nr:response regulator [Synergistota bacterium]